LWKKALQSGKCTLNSLKAMNGEELDSTVEMRADTDANSGHDGKTKLRALLIMRVELDEDIRSMEGAMSVMGGEPMNFTFGVGWSRFSSSQPMPALGNVRYVGMGKNSLGTRYLAV
jgi:hypothetical protein